MRKLVLTLATGLGVGYLPAPGTLGSLWGLLLFYFLNPLPFFPYLLTLVTFLLLAVFIANGAEQYLRQKDSQKIVIDEVIGMWITLSFIDFSLRHLILGFIFFRIFDILKPFPICWVERKLRGGWGVVMDDVVAGLLANLTLRVVSLSLLGRGWG